MPKIVVQIIKKKNNNGIPVYPTQLTKAHRKNIVYPPCLDFHY